VSKQASSAKPISKCRCRFCGKAYRPCMSKAMFRGYCTQGCLIKKVKALGGSPGGKCGRLVRLYVCLDLAHEIGNVYV
jgi:hypothetical protein